MKILPITQADSRNHFQIRQSTSRPKNYTNRESILPANFYYPINFQGKKLNVALEKEKLIKQFNLLLKKDSPKESDEDLIFRISDIIARFLENKYKKIRDLEGQANVIYNSPFLSEKVKRDTLNAMRKEYMRLEKSMPPVLAEKKESDEKIDFQLINKLKTAILNDNFSLDKVFVEYFEPIKNFKTIEELEENYPQIELPKRPEDVIAAKIAKALPKDFYMAFTKFKEHTDSEGIKDYLKKKFPLIMEGVFGKRLNLLTLEETEKQLIALGDGIIDKFENIVQMRMINSVPDKSKINTSIVTDEDFKLLKLDYDDFVLSVVKSIYLDMKRPNEIIYNDGKSQIKVASIHNLSYKFEKFPENYKQFIKKANEIKAAQRDYDSYTDDDFKQRILFYTDKMGKNEELLTKLVEFDSCLFTQDDKVQLTKLLRNLDSVFDNELSLQDALIQINHEKIKPHGTERINESERKAIFNKLKKEQKIAAKLKSMQDEFDEAINLLYKNDLNYSAEIAAFYRPVSVTEDPKNYKFLINLIKKYSDKKTGIISNKSNLNRDILYWNKYIEAKLEDSPLLSKAEKYAADKKGNVDRIKAGRFLFNSAIVDTYKENNGYQSEIIDIIMSNSPTKEQAVEYMCKYDEYRSLSEEFGTKITHAIDLFDYKIPAEKAVLKHIIENDYILNDTVSAAYINSTDMVETIITSKAKSEIMDYYRFPKCIEFFDQFEAAMTTFAAAKASAGIKKLGKNNNALANIYELKIKGFNDRLISYDGTYRFDEFSPVGRH